jgi:3-deoxy-D-manno-octulosonic-acid transferase
MSNFKEIENEMLFKKSIVIVSSLEEFRTKIEDSINGLTYTKNIGVNAKKYVESKSKILDITILKIKKYLV